MTRLGVIGARQIGYERDQKLALYRIVADGVGDGGGGGDCAGQAARVGVGDAAHVGGSLGQFS